MESHISRLIHIAELYYQQNLSQNEVAELLNISRPTVSRYIDEAKREGIVEIIVHSPIRKSASLSKKLRTVFKLREAIVVAGKTDHDTALTQCSSVAAGLLVSLIDNNKSIGITWGRALQQICTDLTPQEFYNIHILQMVGSLSSGNPHIDGIELVQNFAKIFDATYSNIIAPIFVDNEVVYQYLMNSSPIRATLNKVSSLDIAINGIGAFHDPKGSLAQSGCLEPGQFEQAVSLGAVGHFLGRAIDIHGNEVHVPNLYTIAAPLDILTHIPWSIAVCVSAEKAIATYGVLEGHYVNALVVDEPQAVALLSLYDQYH